jgi:phytanoyl-CoA hydroxylase
LVDRLFDPHETGATLSQCPADIKTYVRDLLCTGFAIIPRSLPDRICDDVRNGFIDLAARNEDIFGQNRDEHGHYPRIVNLHTVYAPLFDLFRYNKIALAVQDYLFEAETVLYTSLFYERGSAQSIHRDSPVFTTRPEYRYFGVWVALEDADTENGPLMGVKGGHLLPELDREVLAREIYPEPNSIPPTDNDLWVRYQSAVWRQCQDARLAAELLCAKKGDTIIWHPQAPHGGSEIRDLRRTRYSLVMHTTPIGVPVYHQDVFFNPSKPVSEEAPWEYVSLGQRRYADFHGVSFGHVRSYAENAFK